MAGDLDGGTVKFGVDTEGFEAAERAVAIASGGEIAQFAGAIGERGKHGVTVGDGFVAGEFEAAGEGIDGLDGFGFHDEGQFSMGRKATSDQRMHVSSRKPGVTPLFVADY